MAQAFCQQVSFAANKMDHHPEWRLSNNGKTVDVRLTSHFAGNKVTRLDFELAEAMNEAYSVTVSTFEMFPRITNSQWTTLKIVAGSLAFGLFWYRIVTEPQYELKKYTIPAQQKLAEFKVTTGRTMLQSNADEIAKRNLDSYTLRHITQRNI